MATTRKINAQLLRMGATFELGDNGPGAKSAPVRLLARSKEPVPTFMGAFVHDLSGCVHKDRVAIDYCHFDEEILGYINKFNVGEAGLELAGALCPYGESDRAGEIMAKAAQGVPYEASIDFRPRKKEDIVIEEVKDGEKCEVNGRIMDGPLTVFRRWPLTGVAICPHGRDGETSTMLMTANKNEGELEVTIMDKVIEPVVKGAGQLAVPPETKVEEPKKEDKPTESADRVLFKALVTKFGQVRGAEYFGLGLSLEAAGEKYVEALTADHAKLKADHAALETQYAALKLESEKKASAVAFSPSNPANPDDALWTPEKEKALRAYVKKSGASFETLKLAMIAEEKARIAKKNEA